MRHKLHIFLLLYAVLAIVGCTGNGSVRPDGMPDPASAPNSSHPSSHDTIYTESAAMSIHTTDPERALVIIDSAVIVGNVNALQGEYLKAVTQYGGLHNHPLARQICLDLLSSDADSLTLMQTNALLVSIEYSSGNYPAVIRYATEASRLAHALGKSELVGKMEGFIALAMVETGRAEEGIDRLRGVIDELRKMYTFQSVTAYHSTAKKLLHILDDRLCFTDMVPVCEDMLQLYDELERHTDRFLIEKKGFDPAEFIDFARGQTLAFLTIAYARQYTKAKTPPTEMTPAVRAQLLKNARMAEAEVFSTKWSRSIDCDRMLIGAWPHLGEFERFDKAVERLNATMQDTINFNYFVRLQLRSEAAEMRGRYAEALSYHQRAFAVHDSLDHRNQREQLNELATVYHLQEEQAAHQKEQLARQQAEADARVSHLYLLFTSTALVAAIAFAIYFFYKRREMMKKNKVLARMIAESINQETQQTQQTHPRPLPVREGSIYLQGQNSLAHGPSREGSTSVGTRRVASDTVSPELTRHIASDSAPIETSNASPSSQEVTTPLPHREGPGVGLQGLPGAGLDSDLFAFLRDVILREQLYLDPLLDRQALVDRFGLTKDHIGAAFAKGSPYKSLIDFLTDCRLRCAARLLTERPDLNIADVARESGFARVRTLSSNFKQKYTITPSQFREQQEKGQ